MKVIHCTYKVVLYSSADGRFHQHLKKSPSPPQEVFYLTYTSDDIEGNMHLDTGDKVSFYMETNKQ